MPNLRYKQHEAFISEDFWKIDVSHSVPTDSGGPPAHVKFYWERNRLFDETVTRYVSCVGTRVCNSGTVGRSRYCATVAQNYTLDAAH
jgi:hypothetical protein